MTKRGFYALGALMTVSGVLVMGCDNDPAEGKTKVQASAPVEQAAESASDQVVEYAIASENGSVEFVGAKVTAKHEGAFEKFEGKIKLVEDSIEKSSVSVIIDVASLQIEPAKLEGHLLSGDFFDAKQFPSASFTSTKIEAKKGDKTTHMVTGNLELHGEKKSVSFPATIKKSENGMSVDAEFAINRKDFAIVYPGMPDDLIKDDVLIKLKLNPNKA